MAAGGVYSLSSRGSHPHHLILTCSAGYVCHEVYGWRYNNPSHCVSDATRGFTNFSGPRTATSETKAVICSPARNRSSRSSSIPDMRPAGTITWNFILVSHPAHPKLPRWSRHLAPERSCNHWHLGDRTVSARVSSSVSVRFFNPACNSAQQGREIHLPLS